MASFFNGVIEHITTQGSTQHAKSGVRVLLNLTTYALFIFWFVTSVITWKVHELRWPMAGFGALLLCFIYTSRFFLRHLDEEQTTKED